MDQFFRESLHNAYRTVIEKYFNSSHSNVPIKFHQVQFLAILSLYYSTIYGLGWFFLPPFLHSYAGTPCSFLDQACVYYFFLYLNYQHSFFIYNTPIIFILQVEVKPYVLDDQLCDECQGARCGGKFAPFFCANVTCLQVRSIHTVRLSRIEYIECKLSD